MDSAVERWWNKKINARIGLISGRLSVDAGLTRLTDVTERASSLE